MQKAYSKRRDDSVSDAIVVQPNGEFQEQAGTRRGPIYGLVLCGALLILAIVIGTGVMVDTFRERALANGTRELENTALLLARHFDQQLEDMEVVEKDIVSYVDSFGFTSAEEFKREMAHEDIHLLLKAKMSAMPDLGALNLFDANGKLISSSRLWPTPNVSIGDRPHFKALRDSTRISSYLGDPVVSAVTNTWTMSLARRLTGPDGKLLGIVGRGIEPANFGKFFASLSLVEGATISLFHRDGKMVARYPHVDSLVGKNYSHLPLFRDVLPISDHGTDRIVHSDGIEKLACMRALAKFPLTIITTKPVAAILADWHEQTRFLVVIAFVTVLIILTMLFLIVRQISRHHRAAKQQLLLEKERLNIAVDNMTQGLLLFDATESLVVCNRRYIDMYGLSTEIIKPGCKFRELIQHRKDTGSLSSDPELYYSQIMQEVSAGTVKLVQTSDDRTIQITNRPVPGGGWAATHEDITHRRRAEERIAHLAHYDALTDLPNRILFREQLEQQLGQLESGNQFAVLYIDIDEFKSINDSLGHPVGDELLKAVAFRLRGCIRDTDFIARLGGDEFAVVQTQIHSAADVVELLERIYHAIRQPYDCLGHQVSTDASIGIAMAPKDGDHLDQLLKNADLAMYGAKADGRRTYRFFEPEMDLRMRKRHLLELDLRQIITNNGFADGGFEVHYQPLVSLTDDCVTGCEALLRWRHHERGMISPAEFIPVAEETGLINQLGEWVLATACAEAATWPDHLKLAVNISPVQFKSQTVGLKVAAALASSGFAANRLELEITEAVLIRDDEAALKMLHQLRAMGVRIALDDFGTGYSSLSYLQRFPFDKIKIDRCFMSDLEDAAGSASIVNAVVNIATARNMTTTAEGVETERQRELLRKLGCTEMQGYLFSAAKPAADIGKMLWPKEATKEATKKAIK